MDIKREDLLKLVSLQGGVIVTVSNLEANLAQQDMPYLFNRFCTADSSQNGRSTGLGLFISKKIMILERVISRQNAKWRTHYAGI